MVRVLIYARAKENIIMTRKAFKDLLTSIDVLNTVNGGVSEPYVSIREEATSREVRVRVPGVERDALQVEINNNELSVYYLIPIQSSGKLINMPRIVYSQPIPFFIEVEGIKAVYSDKELLVKLPFNEHSDGYNRKIKIEEE
jgi:HSP20 family molecular chaperone IbpA